MDKGVIIDATMWAQLEDMIFYGSKDDIHLAIGIIAECELDSFDDIGCWYMQQIKYHVERDDYEDSVRLFIARTVIWLKETPEWKKMRKAEEVVWPPRM